MMDEGDIRGNVPMQLRYEAEPGDTLEEIARDFSTTVEDILRINPRLERGRRFTGGEIIIIPFLMRMCRNGISYIVMRGDTLASIAREYNITVAELIRENPFLAIIRLRPGLVICIPRSEPVSCPGGVIYTTRLGDTLPLIAERFNTTVRAILDANPNLNPNNIPPGTQICIPRPRQVPCPNGTRYTIGVGDTLPELARRFNVSVRNILDANPGLRPEDFRPGLEICIPRPQPVPCPNGTRYTIGVGDTLPELARRFNVSIRDILDANPGLRPEDFRPGLEICIPRPQPVPCPNGTRYTIGVGDTLPELARRFNVSVRDILDANPRLRRDDFRPGVEICIPSPGPMPCPGFIYTFRRGDTLPRIARRYNVTVGEIIQVNPGLRPGQLRPGDPICIPPARRR